MKLPVNIGETHRPRRREVRVVIGMCDGQGLRVFQKADEDGSDCCGDHIHHHVRYEEAHLRGGRRKGGRERGREGTREGLGE